jgi:DNA repair protein SbcD/Mre11
VRSSTRSSSLPLVRLLHTSDLHISDLASVSSLDSVVEVALASDVDLVVIAGDLFESARVGPEVVDRTIGVLSRLQSPVVVIPGNHDCIDERSIYHRVDLGQAGDHVNFVGCPEGKELAFDELSLVVWAKGIESHDPENRPLAGYIPAPPGRWSVVVTHGHFVPEGERSDRSSQIRQEEIARLSCHYLALGHWHRFVDVSEGTVTACYSGAPQGSDTQDATVNLVTLHPERGVGVERRRTRVAAH